MRLLSLLALRRARRNPSDDVARWAHPRLISGVLSPSTLVAAMAAAVYAQSAATALAGTGASMLFAFMYERRRARTLLSRGHTLSELRCALREAEVRMCERTTTLLRERRQIGAVLLRSMRVAGAVMIFVAADSLWSAHAVYEVARDFGGDLVQLAMLVMLPSTLIDPVAWVARAFAWEASARRWMWEGLIGELIAGELLAEHTVALDTTRSAESRTPPDTALVIAGACED